MWGCVLVQAGASMALDPKGNCLTRKYQVRPTVTLQRFNELLRRDRSVMIWHAVATHSGYGVAALGKDHGSLAGTKEP
jgi:hypothetical protein